MSADWLTASEFARACGLNERTARRWLSTWRALGVRGIRVVPSRGRHGIRYEAAPSLPDRWRRCELPAPQGDPDPTSLHVTGDHNPRGL